MISLYIDTTSSYLYSAIIKDNILLGFVKQNFKRDMSTYALSEISKMFKKYNIKPNDIDEIVVCNGPGSFTGIRIGITIAKTYAWSLNKKIKTISSLEVMALSNKFDGYKIPIIDARRGYVYGGIYDINNNVIMENQHIKLDTLKVAAENLPGEFKFITNDLILIESSKFEPDFVGIINYCKNKEFINPHAVNPIYLKKTEAEESKNIEC